MAKNQSGTSAVAPNVAWASLRQWFERLNGAVPGKVDASLFKGMSGSAISQVRGALRFLGLVDEAHVPRPEFSEFGRAILSEAPSSDVTALVQRAYSPITGKLEANATQSQLLQAFRDHGGVSGDTVIKAARFYLTAARHVGIPVSPFFQDVAEPAEKVFRSRRKPSRQRVADTAQVATLDGKFGDDRRRYSVPTRDGEIVIEVPLSLTRERWERAIRYLQDELLVFLEDEQHENESGHVAPTKGET